MFATLILAAVLGQTCSGGSCSRPAAPVATYRPAAPTYYHPAPVAYRPAMPLVRYYAAPRSAPTCRGGGCRP